jgi:hypothetical protein
MSDEQTERLEVAKKLIYVMQENTSRNAFIVWEKIQEEACAILSRHDKLRDEELVEGIARHFYELHSRDIGEKTDWKNEPVGLVGAWMEEARAAIKQAREKKEG